VNDVIQTFIRPVAGAFLFAASAKVITDVHPVLAMVMGLLVAGTVHTVKSLAIRPAVTATTAGAGNVPVSIAEDITSTVVSIIAIVIPMLIAVMLVVVGALFVWWVWRRTNRERAGA
jgi:uncharacterized membrane protein AbrB (regulator of aidB expression)